MNSKQISFTKTSRDWFLASCLYDSVEDRDISQTIMLLEMKKANPNIVLPEYGITPFHRVIGSEDREFACRATKACLMNGADPNVRSDEGLTPVHLAAMWGHLDVLDLLLSAGGNPWLSDYDEKNALQYAQEEKNWEAYNLLYNCCDSENFNRTSTLCDVPPCKLELKKVVLYKDDLHVEYEAMPLKHNDCFHHSLPQHKSASTQTPTSHCRSTQNSKKYSRCDVNEQYDDTKYLTQASSEDSLNTRFDWCRQEKDFNLHNEAMKTILNHRRKTTIYEYSPNKDIHDSQGCTLGKMEGTGAESFPSISVKENEQNVKANLLSEFKHKIDQTSNFIYSKDEHCQSSIIKNITVYEKEENNSLNYESEMQDHVNQNKSLAETNCTEIGFIYDQNVNETASYMKLESYDSHMLQSSVYESNMSSNTSAKGIIKDSHKVSNCDQTSIFSDIDSDISVCVISGTLQSSKNVSKILLTDDEISLSGEVTSSKISINKYFSCNENIKSSHASVSSTLYPPNSELSVSEHKNTCSVKSELESKMLQSVDIQSSDVAVDTKAIPAVAECEVRSGQLTSYSLKWEEADIVLTSDDDEEKELSISEEYLYTDEEEGIVLTEKRYIVNGVSIPVLNKNSHRDDDDDDCCSVTGTDTGSTSSYDTDTLRKELSTRGFCPGPITGHTKRVYLRKLKRFRRRPCPLFEQNKPEYSPELQRVVVHTNMYLLKQWSHLEQEMCCEFSMSRYNTSWRDGLAKTSFTYLLLDPRITCNLPANASNLQLNQIWEKFLQAIFYVGKGKRSRPYTHLYQSVAIWEKRHLEKSCSKKVERILEIWQSGHGVVCLHVFQNIIPVEAYTREAAMISALTLGRLTNEKSGEYYGPAANWSQRQKRQLGAVLLYRACQVFMGEGERQIRPADID